MSSLPNIKKDFSDWYNEVIYQAELADQSPVRGSIVIRPYGYALWEQIRDRLDKRIKETGHHNASFPLLIPESFLKREAKHIEGFSPELAVVTHAGGKKLDEPLVIRPTSETIIHYMFAKWMKSWRDLPLKINQWANVVRWEMRPRAFLRTTEFFWQEGHTAHATYQEAYEEATMMMQEYVDLAQEWLAIPVITGRKTEHEKFPGADITLTFEALMQDGKALQMGTSHLLAQGFAQSFEMQFQDAAGTMSYPYLTSWGVTTRLIGAVVMTHGDEKGLVLPPKVAPIQLVIIPIYKADQENIVMAVVYDIATQLKSAGIRVHIDADQQKSPGAKFYHWELKGVPLRMEVGPRDVAQHKVVLADRLGIAKEAVAIDTVVEVATQKLSDIQQALFKRAHDRLKSMWHTDGGKLIAFGPTMEEHGGLYQVGWCQDSACEQELKKYKAFTRCLLQEKTIDVCFNCDKKSIVDVLVAKSY